MSDAYWDDFNLRFEGEGLTFRNLDIDNDTGEVIVTFDRDLIEEEQEEEKLEYQFVDPPFPTNEPYVHLVPGTFPGIVECKSPDYCLICDQFEEPPAEAPLENESVACDCYFCRLMTGVDR